MASCSSCNSNDPDPITGLTSCDKYNIEYTWGKVRTDMTKNGVALLILFFEKFPHEQNHFPFRDIPLNQLATDKKFQAHCNSVMYAMSSIIDNINNAELLINILQKIGDNHNRRKICPQSFQNIKITILELFSTFMNNDEVNSWEKALNVCFKIIEGQLTN